jgi:cyclic-di-GMP-binding protein
VAATNTFDITSGVDLQEVDNAVNQTLKELGQRFDFRGLKWELTLDKGAKTVTLLAPDDLKLKAIWEVLVGKLVKRGVAVKNMKRGDAQQASGGAVRQVVTLQQGVPTETAKQIVKLIKDQKFKKVTASIMGEQVRVASPDRDALQEVIAFLRKQTFDVEIGFGNYRSG